MTGCSMDEQCIRPDGRPVLRRKRAQAGDPELRDAGEPKSLSGKRRP